MDYLVNLNRFLNYLEKNRNYSENTIIAYKKDLVEVADYYYEVRKNDLTLKALNKNILKAFLRSVIQKKFSRKTYNRKVASLKSFLKYLFKNELIKTDLTSSISSLRVEKSLPDYVTEQQTELIFENLCSNDFLSSRESLIIEVFYSTGIRLAELHMLKTENFNRKAMLLKVLGKGNKERLIPISEYITEKLDSYLYYREEQLKTSKYHTDYLFISKYGNHLSRGGVQQVVRKLLLRMATVKKTSPHVLRHTFATHLLNNGADIMSVKELLGHESVSTTQIYAHVSIEKLKEVYKKSHPKGDE